MPPPPYCYHPELFPELALNNPEPYTLPKKLTAKIQNIIKVRLILIHISERIQL